MKSASSLAALVLLAAFVTSASEARAQPATQASGERDARIALLQKRGVELLEQKRFAEALAAYDEAYAIFPSPSLLYNRGRALDFLGRFPEALEAIELFASSAPLELRERVPGLPQLLSDLRRRVGTLIVTSPVAGARVLVNYRQVGVTPIRGPLKLAAGHLSIEVFADDYFPMRREIDLPGAVSRDVDFPLVSRGTSGLLVVRSHVDAARVSVDGRALGLAPTEAGLVAGTHRITAERDGFTPAETQVVLGVGERKETWLDPAARPALYTRWWFWTAIGVVVTGGVLTAVALTTQRSTPSGDYSPGVVRF